MTDKDIQETIDNCYWRADLDGVNVCKGELTPCMRVIEKGNCDTLKKLFAESEE